MSVWWKSYYDTVAEQLPGIVGDVDEMTLAEVTFLRKHIFQKGPQILDIGCGAGRHATALQNLGCRVTAVDVSQAMMTRCAMTWFQHGTAPESPLFICEDMRTLSIESRVDGAMFLDMAFCVFDRDEECVHTLNNLKRFLSPGAPVVVELYNPAFWASRQGPAILNCDGRTLRRTYQLTKGRIVDVIEGLPHGPARQSLRCFTPTEIATVFAKAGFNLTHLYGRDGFAVPAEPRAVQGGSALMWAVGRVLG